MQTESMKLSLVYYPNKALLVSCTKIEQFDEPLHIALTEMTSLMQKKKGVGLASNQVGLTQCFFLMKDNNGVIREILNPIVVKTQGTVMMSEGCLSAPTVFIPIRRPEAVLLHYQNRNGEKKELIAEGIEARTILHECDHLNGQFYFNKVNREMRRIAISKLKKVMG